MGILQARILEWVAMPSSWDLPFNPPSISSQPRDQTQVSRIAGGFFLPSEPPGKPKDTLHSICIPWADKWSLSHVGSSEVFHWAGLYVWNSFRAVDLHLPFHQSEQSYPQTSCYRPLAGNLRIDHRPQVQRKQLKK